MKNTSFVVVFVLAWFLAAFLGEFFSPLAILTATCATGFFALYTKK